MWVMMKYIVMSKRGWKWPELSYHTTLIIYDHDIIIPHGCHFPFTGSKRDDKYQTSDGADFNNNNDARYLKCIDSITATWRTIILPGMSRIMSRGRSFSSMCPSSCCWLLLPRARQIILVLVLPPCAPSNFGSSCCYSSRSRFTNGSLFVFFCFALSWVVNNDDVGDDEVFASVN